MFYNLSLFGKRLEEIRKNLNITQKEISRLTGIDAVTIRRIEYGKVVPKLDTLEILSPIFKEDLISLLIQYRIDDYSVFYEIKNRIESKLDDGEFHTLNTEFEELNALLSSTKNPYYKNLISQLILLTEAVILYRNNNNDISLNKLVEAIRITTSNFNLDDYKEFVYSSMETRILMNMGFIFNKLNHNEKYVEIMEFCMDSVDSNDEIYPKLCHNLAGVYSRNKDFKKALKYYNMGIRSCQESRNFNGLSLLYYGKGSAEYRLDKEAHIDSLKTSIYLCKALGQNILENTITNNCEKFFGIK